MKLFQPAIHIFTPGSSLLHSWACLHTHHTHAASSAHIPRESRPPAFPAHTVRNRSVYTFNFYLLFPKHNPQRMFFKSSWGQDWILHFTCSDSKITTVIIFWHVPSNNNPFLSGTDSSELRNSHVLMPTLRVHSMTATWPWLVGTRVVFNISEQNGNLPKISELRLQRTSESIMKENSRVINYPVLPMWRRLFTMQD